MTLNVLVDADGSIAEAEVLNPTGDKIEVEAINTVRTWKFKPATCGGRAVASEMTVELSVNLD